MINKKIKSLIIAMVCMGAVFASAGCAEKKEVNNADGNTIVSEQTGDNTIVSANPTPAATNTPKPTATPSPTPKPETTPAPRISADNLKDMYKDYFPIGVALPNQLLGSMTDKIKKNITSNYNIMTCENETKPDAILDKKKSQAGLPNTYYDAEVHFDNAKYLIKFAQENNMKMRLHTLVWHSQTPRWFFTEDYTDGGELVSREVMLIRMDNYIKRVCEYYNENYADLIYAIDVCNEAFDPGNGDENGIRMKDNCWYDTVGPDYYYQAFVSAKKYANPNWKLFYNDYGCVGKTSVIINNLKQANEEGLIDGIGMQSHLDIKDSIGLNYKIAIKKFCDEGYEVQITELDIGMDEINEINLRTQGRKYKIFFHALTSLKDQGYNISAVTLWGINDSYTWRTGKAPLLFDAKTEPKEAFYGAMQSPDIAEIE